MNSEQQEIEVARRRCSTVMERIQRLPRRTNITDSSRRTLLKLAHSELNFLSHLSSSAAAAALPHRNLSVNIGHLEAVVHLLQQHFVNGVSRICKPIPLSNGCQKDESRSKSVHVDIVCTVNKHPVWIVVSDRNPKYVSWHGCRRDKGLKLRVEQLLAAAQSSQVMKPHSIILFFSHGLSEFVRERLRDEFGAVEFSLEFQCLDFDFCDELEGEWVNVLARSYQEACVLEIRVDSSGNAVLGSKCDVKGSLTHEKQEELARQLDSDNAFLSLISRIKLWPRNNERVDFSKYEDVIRDGDDLVNFDTTALIALVSGISNGCTEKLLAVPEIELRQRFKGNFEFVIAQVMSEVQNPMLAELAGIVDRKRGIVCESVFSEFKELVSLCGGPNEKLRANKILKCLMVVRDSPSERMMGLPTTRKLALKNKIVFGTGDCWHAPTLTANMAFVRAVSQTGMSLFTIEHRSRALTGD